MFAGTELHVIENFHLKHITTMGVGGPCKYYIVPRNVEEVGQVQEICREKEMKLIVIGNGSNILVDDEGIDGVVLHIGKGMRSFQLSDSRLYADAGVLVPKIAFSMAKEGIKNFEFMAGIPGTIGGAVVMNAGCIGKETSSILRSVTLLNENGELEIKNKDELDMSFRNSAFIGKKHIILKAVFDAISGDPEQILMKTKEAADIRKGKFPINVATVGSTFKSPPEGPHPGRLIEAAGLKGYRIGGAAISLVHANWIINDGTATANDVKALIDIMRNTVAQKLGIEMEPEVLFVS